MTTLSRARLVVGGALLIVAGFAASAQQPTTPADDPRFTGKSDVLDSKDIGVSRRRFEPGARSAWHSHSKGQLLFIEDGCARTQKRGEAIRELAPGESDYTAPNVIHWHGAVPHTHVIQVAVSWGEIKWMEKVTDEEYAGKK